jgi:hypothetical protein
LDVYIKGIESDDMSRILNNKNILQAYHGCYPHQIEIIKNKVTLF